MPRSFRTTSFRIKRGTGKGFPPSIFAIRCQYHSTNVPYSHFIHLQLRYLTSVIDSVIIWNAFVYFLPIHILIIFSENANYESRQNANFPASCWKWNLLNTHKTEQKCSLLNILQDFVLGQNTELSNKLHWLVPKGYIAQLVSFKLILNPRVVQ